MEIGSEFEWDDSLQFHKKKYLIDEDINNFILTFSGRTSIEVVLNNIVNAKKAILPSYCCDSMIDPFRKAGIDVCFYDVNYDDKFVINQNIPDDVDILLRCNYFGYNIQQPDVSEFKQRGGIVIEDVTHSLLSSKMYDSQSDFLVASIRKWVPVLCGGYCVSVNSILNKKPRRYPSNWFVKEKRKAMVLKREYLLDNDEQKKLNYLSMFSYTNEWLSNNYSDLLMDKESTEILSEINFEWVKQVRIRNAKQLYEGLKKCNLVKTLFPLELMECPLFVPIIIENGKRDLIRKKLIDNDIYCPIHWPNPNECQSNLYDIELSLVCDQRYNEEDMQRIIDVLCN